MYKIIKDGTAIGMTEAPNYIKQHENGCFVLCPEPEASGIAFAGTAYHLLGREELPDTKSVMLEEVDAGTVIGEVQSGVDSLREDLATTDEAAISLYETLLEKDEADAAQDDALIELYEKVGG